VPKNQKIRQLFFPYPSSGHKTDGYAKMATTDHDLDALRT